jgi:sensor histidine kinase regulating citrate/malate metabolism
MLAFDYQYVVLEEDGSFEYLLSHWQLLAMHLLGLVSLFCILFSYKKLQQNFRLCTELSLLEQEEHSLNQYVEEAKTRYDRTKSFRHDIKNHIEVVKNLLQSGKLEEAVSYIEDMDDMAENMSFPCSTNNPVVDILVENKLGIAKSMGIDVDCSLLLPYPCGLKDIDICIILSNALDNAIQAVKRLDAGMEKYIQVSGRIQGDFLMMEVENSFHGKGAFKKGTGLSNVKKVAEKYGGAMSIETQENKFVLHVLLILSQHPEGILRQMDYRRQLKKE